MTRVWVNNQSQYNAQNWDLTIHGHTYLYQGKIKSHNNNNINNNNNSNNNNLFLYSANSIMKIYDTAKKAKRNEHIKMSACVRKHD